MLTEVALLNLAPSTTESSCCGYIWPTRDLHVTCMWLVCDDMHMTCTWLACDDTRDCLFSIQMHVWRPDRSPSKTVALLPRSKRLLPLCAGSRHANGAHSTGVCKQKVVPTFTSPLWQLFHYSTLTCHSFRHNQCTVGLWLTFEGWTVYEGELRQLLYH